ncbi:DoxX family protein [Coralliovum pocilloporae]|uniref:DoxX family protein n=1 Tax=Coralliovum pocilloporae TaxID=3066369 RepID=UPI003306A2CD
MTQDTSQNTSLALGATLTRLSLGTILLSHGILKVAVFTIPGTVGYFASLGLPAIAAYLTIFAEIVGGTAIILGTYTRLAALLSIPLLLGALWAHAGNGWVFSSEGGGWEFPLLLVVLAATVTVQGGGAFALKKLPVVDPFIPAALKA